VTDLQQFYDKCQGFDWFYEMSDDGRVWRNGVAAHAALKAEADSSPEKLAIYGAWKAHIYSGVPWGTAKIARPERPHDDNR
jgi:hypothetical protein